MIGYLSDFKSSPNEIIINIHIPSDLNLRFYDDDDTTMIYEDNYSLYLLMISGLEFETNPIAHTHHFIDDRLLAYFLDIDLYNLSGVKDRFLLNGKVQEWSFSYDRDNSQFMIEAIDLSIFNSTNHYWYMDFGNSFFLNLTLEEESDIYIHNIVCFHEYNNRYRPFLNLTYNNNQYLERMAWNGTITF